MQIIKLLRIDKYQNVYLALHGQHRNVLPMCRFNYSISQIIKTKTKDLLKIYNNQCDIFVLVVMREDRIGCAAWPYNAGYDYKIISAEQADVG